jgi:tRNA threonylcarbamoyladenosine dehydratase
MPIPEKERHDRTRRMIGDAGLTRLRAARVTVFGLGGVGSHAAEALARSGIGRLVLADFDRVEASNLNRQLYALESTIGRMKTEVAAQRIHDIDPDIAVTPVSAFADESNLAELLEDGGAVIDAIDSVPSKVHLLALAHGRGIPIVSCMGAAGKTNPLDIRADDIGRTRGCPLARNVRQRLRRLGIVKGIRCVYSPEKRCTLLEANAPDPAKYGKRPQGSMAVVPGIIGYTAAGLLINDILADDG